jgi:hypothetical protein
MYWYPVFLLFFFDSTTGYLDGSKWKLAYNIHASDGHDFGYGADAWDDATDVGTDETAFTSDYKNYDVTTEVANFIAIVRHQNGNLEAVRVWKFLISGGTLNNYLNKDNTSRLMATYRKSTFSYISPTMLYQDSDPIFAVDGGLVFNWWYSNNGVRIGNNETCVWGDLPGVGDNNDDFHGIGNEFGANTETGEGSAEWTHDVSVHQGDCHGTSCTVQGTDHGTQWGSDGILYGQYAIYISDVENTFPLEDTNLQLSIFDETTISPTLWPTADPTVIPTVQPTAYPTIEPTLQPTMTPTIMPTVQPTSYPTIVPTLQPSTWPTIMPTTNPTPVPTSDTTTSRPPTAGIHCMENLAAEVANLLTLLRSGQKPCFSDIDCNSDYVCVSFLCILNEEL